MNEVANVDVAYENLDAADRMLATALVAQFKNLSPKAQNWVRSQLGEQNDGTHSPGITKISGEENSKIANVLSGKEKDPYDDLDEAEKTEVYRKYAIKFIDVMNMKQSSDNIDCTIPTVKLILETYGLNDVEKIFSIIGNFYCYVFWGGHTSLHNNIFNSNLAKLSHLCCDKKISQSQIDDLSNNKLFLQNVLCGKNKRYIRDDDCPNLARLASLFDDYKKREDFPFNSLEPQEKTEVCKRYADKFYKFFDESSYYLEKYGKAYIPATELILETYGFKNVETIFRTIFIVYGDVRKHITFRNIDELKSKLMRLAHLCCDKKLSQSQIDGLDIDVLKKLKSSMKDSSSFDTVLDLSTLIKLQSL